MKKWKVAIVGAGYMAQEHARAFSALNNVEIVGVCSRTFSRTRALAEAYKTNTYESIGEMYHATQADVVIVAVNELSMLDVCSECFEYAWLCFLEKPVGVDLVAAQNILSASREFKARAYVALNRRSYSSTRQALARLTSHDGPRLISITDQQDMISARESGQPEEVVRNYMFANSIHLIDYLSLFGRGEIVDVKKNVSWVPEKPEYVVATIHYSSGDVGVYQAIWNGPGPWSVTITNAKIRAELRPLEKLLVQHRGERTLSEVPLDENDISFKPGLYFQATQVVELLSGGSASLATIDEAFESMQLCAKIYGLI